jgi:hypothetical protein
MRGGRVTAELPARCDPAELLAHLTGAAGAA